MPELPEVETIKLELNRLIVNKTIKAVDIRLPKQILGNKGEFIKKVTGVKINSIARRAKTLIIGLNNSSYLVFHLKMTGQLIYKRKNGKLSGGGHPIKHNLQELPNKYSHVIFNFSDGSQLFFNDTRQFGWVKLVNAKQLANMQNNYGPEPLSKYFTFNQFKKLFNKKTQNIKTLLMDQKFIAGIGNIYAQEALFCAGIHPRRRANKTSETELKKLYNCLIKILKLAVSKKGTSADTYVDAFGREGNMFNCLKVYGRAGEKCKKCGGILKYLRQAQRSTVYCDKCQK